MEANTAIALSKVAVPIEDVETTRVISGEPQDGATALGVLDFGQSSLGIGNVTGLEFGVWETTEGAATDTEAEEVFFVLAGTATIEFLDDGFSLDIRTGDLVRLRSGARTRWTVHEPLRKLYFAPTEPQLEGHHD